MRSGLTLVQGGFGTEMERAVSFQGGYSTDSSSMQVAFQSYPGSMLSWDHTTFRSPSESPESLAKLESLRSILEAIKKSPEFAGAVRQGRPFGAAFILKNIKAFHPDQNTMFESEDSKDLRGSLKSLVDTQPFPLLVVHFELTTSEDPTLDMLNWLRTYKAIHSVPLT